MTPQLTIKSPLRQKGLALVILIVAIALAFISYIISELSVSEIHHQQDVKTLAALKKAKQALINYAVTYGDLDGDADMLPDFPGEYGFLPCPDYNGGLAEGLEDNGNCGARGVSKIGYLPWRTLDIPQLYGESGTCLFYAVTGDYKNDESVAPSFKTFMLNGDTNGTFQTINELGMITQGVNPEDRIVAIVFSSGKVLAGQSRTFSAGSACGQDYANETEYLEGDGVTDNGILTGVADTIDQFIHTTVSSENAGTPYNDVFITITRKEIWSAIQQRSDFNDKMTNLTEALALCLSEYANFPGNNNRLPWPAPLALADYRVDGQYNDMPSPGIYAGRVPYGILDSNTVMSGAYPDILFGIPGDLTCNGLPLSIGPDIANLNTVNDEYRQLWKNWKDHFYYALSAAFEPAGVPAVDCPTATNCIQVNGLHVAGIVFYSGRRQPGITRNSPPIDADDKATIANYIEPPNEVEFAGAVGDNSDSYILNPGNDEMFCIFADSLPLTAGPCP